MNLHIVPDNTFINAFYDNLKETGLLEQNRIVVRSNEKSLSKVKRDVPFAPLYSAAFRSLTGDTVQYEQVFIHYLTPLLYRWIVSNKFKSISWMIWGGDLYNLPSLDHLCYEPITQEQYIAKDWSLATQLYEFKVWAFHSRFKKMAYAKVDHVLTWMEKEYSFAINNLHLQADRRFFFYENEFPYAKLDSIRRKTEPGERLRLVIGNSGTPSNNHLDAIDYLEKNNVQADLLVPASYGDKRYISFLKKNLRYAHGSVQLIDRYMPFEEYLQFLSDADGLVMNTIRPQGYGNILMMFYMNKPVFFNEKNISLPDLAGFGFRWRSMRDLSSYSGREEKEATKDAVINLLSHQNLLDAYRTLFR